MPGGGRRDRAAAGPGADSSGGATEHSPRASTPAATLAVAELYKTFNGGTVNEVRALRGVSLDLPPGAFLVVLGGNGSGKSTLLSAIAGTFRVDAGRIHLADQEVTAWPEHRRARLIGRVFQNPFTGTAPHMSIAENLALAARRGQPRDLRWALSHRFRAELRDRVRQLQMGLEDRLDNAIGSLSGGQRQALTLLMATWRNPALLLLDEHTAALDPKSAEQVIGLTREMVARHRLTTLMVTHSMQQAANLGDRIVILHQGAVAYHFEGADKQRLRVEDLLARFEELRRRDLLDASAAALLQQTYL
ncbi:MAG: ATP-binding cassette domain-containing protein [Verrucomicrobia bacterium]|nr:ATP-binding cassette domain-containing protein [Verrucomicrobiota bacterium]